MITISEGHVTLATFDPGQVLYGAVLFLVIYFVARTWWLERAAGKLNATIKIKENNDETKKIDDAIAGNDAAVAKLDASRKQQDK